MAIEILGGLLAFIAILTMINKRAGIIGNLVVFIAGFVWALIEPNSFHILGKYRLITVELVLRFDILSKFFILLILGFGVISSMVLYDFVRKGRNIKYINILLSVNVFSMILVTLSFDFISFYLFWEFMTLATFLMLAVGEWNDRVALKAAYKYLLMSVVSSMTMLMAIFLLFKYTGTFSMQEISLVAHRLNNGQQVLITVLLLTAFFTKFAAMPLHTWLPDAYAQTITPFTVYVAAISSRIGIYGMMLWFFSVLGQVAFYNMKILGISFAYLFAWVGALTMVIPTFTALMQDNAKKLMTWHGIGQGGYMMVGLAAGGALGFTGSVFHILNHGLYIALLFVSVGAVIYRTGTDDLNKLGGLIKKMPLAFLGTLIGIIGLAGIPPLNGFVSKWFLYKGLIQTRNVFLAEMAFLGTLGTILSVYKYIHNIFLGRLPQQYENLKGTPLGFAIPIWILSVLCLLFGVFPGLATIYISKMQVTFGLPVAPVTLSGIATEAGALNMNIVGPTFLMALIVAGIVFWLGGRHRYVGQDDNYAAGEILTPNSAYHYSAKFYAPLYRLIEKPLRPTIDSFYNWIGVRVKELGGTIARYAAYSVTSALAIYVAFIALVMLWILRSVL